MPMFGPATTKNGAIASNDAPPTSTAAHTVNTPTPPLILPSIANLFAIRFLVHHSFKHTPSTSRNVLPAHCGTLSTSQYTALTELLALVCNPDADPGHVMAIALQDFISQPPRVIVAINQASGGQNRTVLVECRQMLQNMFQELERLSPDDMFKTRDGILTYAATFGYERLCLHLGIKCKSSPDPQDATGSEHASTLDPCSHQERKIPTFLPKHLLALADLVNGEITSPTSLTSQNTRARNAFREVAAQLRLLSKTALFQDRIVATTEPSVQVIVEFLVAIHEFFTTLGNTFTVVLEAVSSLSKSGLHKSTLIRRIDYLCWYVRAANFMVNLAAGNALDGQRPLSTWFGTMDVDIVDLPDEAFTPGNTPPPEAGNTPPPETLSFPQSLPPRILQRFMSYRATRSPRPHCKKPPPKSSPCQSRTASPALPASASPSPPTPPTTPIKKTRAKGDCHFCAENVDEQEDNLFHEAYGGGSGKDAGRGSPTVHAEVLLAYYLSSERTSSADRKQRRERLRRSPVYICSYKKSCFLCAEFFRCFQPRYLYTTKSHDIVYYKWRLLEPNYVSQHIPHMAGFKKRFVDKINSIVHDAIPAQLPADCFTCCKTKTHQSEDIELEEIRELGKQAYTTQQWSLPGTPSPPDETQGAGSIEKKDEPDRQHQHQPVVPDALPDARRTHQHSTLLQSSAKRRKHKQ